jgi:L-fuculose-phosphate aldolase
VTELEARRDLAEIGRLLYERDLLASRDGNLSVLLDRGRILTTPAGACKGRLAPEDFILCDGAGNPLSQAGRKPSTELKMHLAVYAVRPDVRAVVHTHPPAATAFAIAGVPLDRAALAEVVYNLGAVPIADYALPSTQQLASIIGQYIQHHQALLLANHGVLAVGEDAWDAYYRLEGVEHFARILLYARQLGGARELSAAQVAELCDLRRGAGVGTPNPLCDAPMPAAARGPSPVAQRPGTAVTGRQAPPELVEKVTREVLAQLRGRLGDNGGRAASGRL